MVFLVVKYGERLEVVSPETYGMDTWGGSHQEGIEFKKDGWYSTWWSAGNEWIEDTNEEDKLDVVLETENFEEVLKYFIEHSPKEYRKANATIKEIINDYLDFDDYFRGRDLEAESCEQ